MSEHLDLEFTVYATNLDQRVTGAMAVSQAREPVHPDMFTTVTNFRPLSGNASDFHLLSLQKFEKLPENGWVRCTVLYEYNANTVIPYKPLVFYVGEPTDWPTGMVSGHLPMGQVDGPPYTQGPVFTVAVRRAR